jgi:hypothetical protein
MANFKTHFLVAFSVSGMVTIACLKVGLVSARETPLLFGLGTFGGLLPDIDSDHSVPIRISFNLLAFCLAFATMFLFVSKYTVLELAAIWLGVFVGVRYLVLEIFMACTVHRGVFHSLLAAVFFCVITASLSFNVFAKSAYTAWLYGSFIAMGYLIHLLLDEVYSVDLLNRNIKSSFGSALKILSLQYWRASLLLLIAVVGVYSTVPSPSGFLHITLSKLEKYYTSSTPWLLPNNGRWFDNMASVLMRAFSTDSTPP